MSNHDLPTENTWWVIHAQDPLFDEFARQSLRLEEARRAALEAEREKLRPAFEAVLVGVALLVVLPGMLLLIVALSS